MLRFKQRRRSPTASPALTASQRRVIRTLTTAMDAVRDGAIRNEGQLLDAVLHGPSTRLIDLVPETPWYEAQAVIQDELAEEIIAAGHRYALAVPTMQKATVTFRFDSARPEAAAWASKEAAALIVQVVEEQRAIVRDLASRASMGELAPRDVARQVRDVIGLTEQQAGWVANFRQRQILELQDRGLSPSQVAERAERATARYHRRIHRYRSETIARTEILMASHEGRRESWDQALEEGFIDRQAMQEWSAEVDDRVCEICESYDREQVPIGEQFPDGDPPIHPMCRCDVLLIPR